MKVFGLVMETQLTCYQHLKYGLGFLIMLALFEQWVLLLKNPKLALCIEAARASDTWIVGCSFDEYFDLLRT
jgi:hypothetical protein